MELRDWRADRRLAPNWGDSDESTKQGWANVEATGTMDNGWENVTQLHITLMGEGEVLLDNIELTAANWVTNIIGNGTFEDGTAGWVFQGNHNATGWETSEGYASARSLHLRTTGRGDSGANRIRTQLPFTMASGTTNVTLRAKVRWLRAIPTSSCACAATTTRRPATLSPSRTSARRACRTASAPPMPAPPSPTWPTGRRCRPPTSPSSSPRARMIPMASPPCCSATASTRRRSSPPSA